MPEEANEIDLVRELQRRVLIEVMAHRIPNKGDLVFDAAPPGYQKMVEDFLEPARPSFNYQALVDNYLTIDGFLCWARIHDGYHPAQGRRVLSSGCGVGGSLVAYHALNAAQVVGTEVDAAFCALSAARTEGLPGIEVVQIEPDRPMPFADGAFDLIESLDVVEHVDDPVAYLLELGRVLAPGGTVLLAMPNRRYPWEQHTGVFGPPWLPVDLANALCRAIVRLPGISEETRQRVGGVPNVRTGNYSWRRIEELAALIGASAQRVHRRDHSTHWPQRTEHPWIEWWARQPRTAGLAPTRQLVAILRKAPG